MEVIYLKKIIKILLIILPIVTLIISSYFLYKNLKEDKKQEDIFEEIKEVAEENSISENNEEQQHDIDMTKLYNTNSDIVAWIRIENTNIDYPVMQTKNNPNYYLRKNFYKQYSYLGTPYLAESCDINASDNFIIYGHHINNSKMFGELENYRKKEYYNKHKFIKFFTLKENKEY